MATPSYGTNDANSTQNWEKRLYTQIVYRSPLSALIGDDEDSIIQLKKQPAKEGGDNIRYNILAKLLGAGFSEGETATGNGETMSIFQDMLKINELGHLVTTPTKGRNIVAQRIPWDLRAQAHRLLSTWKAERMGVTFFNQVCGYTPANTGYGADSSKYIGFNEVTAPARQLWADQAGAVNDGDEDLVAGDDFTLNLIDYAVERAITDEFPIRPLNIKAGKNGSDLDEPKFVLYLHPYQVTQLRKDNSKWTEIQLAAMKGGEISKNRIYTGALGEYNNVILRRAIEVTPGVHSGTGVAISNVRRATMLGAQAAGLAFGTNHGENSYHWNEEKLDHNRNLETSMLTMFGMKKMRYTVDSAPVDAGALVISSYSPRALS